ncbi:hypothetical protein SprV_0702417900 [Sparganum proliferum]
MVLQLHDCMMARVKDNGAVSEVFAVTNGVKQGCVLAPTLFSLMFAAILMDACRDERPPTSASLTGRTVAFRINGRCTSTTTFHKFLFADDCALITISEGDMQRSMDLFSAACEIFGLVINKEKTMVMHQSPPNTATQQPPDAPQISVDGT